MRAAPFDLSVIVACFDEEEALPHLFAELGRLEAAAGKRGLRLEVVAVDDGSGDATGRLLADWAGARPDRAVLTHEENRGFGAAFRTGLRAARGGVLVSYDADATYPVLDVLRLFDALAGADVAGASPFTEGGASTANPLRALLSKVVAGLYRLALRERARLTAYTCAFRAYRRDALRGAVHEADGFLAAAELLSRLLVAGARVREVPSALSRRVHGRSKMKVLRTALAHLGLLARIAARGGPFGAARPKLRRRARLAPVRAPADLAAWNAELNRTHPMSLIERHPNPVVRAIEARRRREVVRLAAPRRGRRLLDVGAERGAYAGPLRARGARRVALDIDAGVLAGGDGTSAVAADARLLPFPGGSFSRVIVPETLEHCPSPEGVAAEALRVVVDSGRVTFSVPDDRAIGAAKALLRLPGLSRLRGGLAPGLAPGHLHVFTRETLSEVLSAAGRLVTLRRDPLALAYFAVVVPRPEVI